MHVCMYVWLYVCMYACMYVCIYVCMYWHGTFDEKFMAPQNRQMVFEAGVELDDGYEDMFQTWTIEPLRIATLQEQVDTGSATCLEWTLIDHWIFMNFRIEFLDLMDQIAAGCPWPLLFWRIIWSSNVHTVQLFVGRTESTAVVPFLSAQLVGAVDMHPIFLLVLQELKSLLSQNQALEP